MLVWELYKFLREILFVVLQFVVSAKFVIMHEQLINHNN